MTSSLLGGLGPVGPAFRIVRARAVLLRRWIAEHAFVLFVLGPILVGAVLWTSEQYLRSGRSLLADRLAADAASVGGVPGLVGWSLALLVTFVLWPGSLREAFGSRPGEDLLDALPVAEVSRFVAALGSVLCRSLPLAALVLAAATAMYAATEARSVAGHPALGWALDLFLALSLAAVFDLALVLLLARLGWLSGGRLMTLAGVSVAAASIPSLRFLVLPLWLPAVLVESVLGRSLGVSATLPPQLYAWVALELVLAASVAAWLSIRYRRHDMERVARIARRSNRFTALPLPAVLERRIAERLGNAVTASLRRDLRLVLRRFSPVVPLSMSVALVASVLVVRLATDGTVVAAWRAELLVAGFVVAILAVVSIVPFLLADQLPQLWIERTTGVTPQQVWWGKALMAALLALVPLAMGCALLVVLLPPRESWSAVLQLLAGGGVVAACVGASVFEIAEEPRLGLLFAGFVGLALASLYLLYPQAWFLWLAATGWAVGKMVERGARRVRFTDVPK